MKNLVTGAVGLAAVYLLIRPNQASRIIEAQGAGMSAMIRAATGGMVVPDRRTNAEIFHEEAMRAIGDFWSGFSDG